MSCPEEAQQCLPLTGAPGCPIPSHWKKGVPPMPQSQNCRGGWCLCLGQESWGWQGAGEGSAPGPGTQVPAGCSHTHTAALVILQGPALQLPGKTAGTSQPSVKEGHIILASAFRTTFYFKLQTQGWKGAALGPWLCVTALTTGLCPPPAGKRIKKDFPFLFLACFFHQSSCKRQPCLTLGKGTWDCPHRTTTQSQGSHTGPSSVSLFTLRKEIHFTQGNVAIPRGSIAGTSPWFRCMFRQCYIVFLSPEL